MEQPGKLTPEQFARILHFFAEHQGRSTIEEIVAATGIELETVQNLIHKLLSKEAITIDEGAIKLGEALLDDAHHAANLRRRTLQRAKFEKHAQNPIYQAEITHTQVFNPAEHTEYGKFKFKRTLSPFEVAYCFESYAVIVWDEGPRLGEVARVIALPSEVNSTSYAEFSASLTTLLSEILELHPDPKSFARRIELQAQALLLFENTYHSRGKYIGWEIIRLMDTPDAVAIHEMLLHIYTTGLTAFLKEYAENRDLNRSKSFYERDVLAFGNTVVSATLDKLFYGSDKPPQWEGESIILKHRTNSHILLNVIQLGGLASLDYANSQGLNKYSGGEKGGRYSYTPSLLSFWYSEDGKPILSGGYGSYHGLEYPMMWGIGEENAEQLNLSLGSMANQQEVTVPGLVPFRLIDYLFVPDFKVEEVREVLHFHGIDNIKVRAFNQSS